MATNLPVGTALLDRDLLRGLERLWQGNFAPSYLQKAELALRAFLVAPKLIVSRLTGSPEVSIGDYDDDIEPPWRPFTLYEQPFGDHLLDYEFVYPREPHPFREVSPTERTALHTFVEDRIIDEARHVMPAWIKTTREARAFLDAWYEGRSISDCERAARFEDDPDDHDWDLVPDESDPLPEKFWEFSWLRNGDRFWSHPVFDTALQHAEYIVGCHRAGLLVFGDSPLTRACKDHVFTAWPERLFEQFGRDFRRLSEEVSGPEVAFCLPPLLGIVMGRATHRESIPLTIIEMREEYKAARVELWSILDRMWNANTFATQVALSRTLELAAASIVPAAFRSKANALELAIDIASLSASSVAKSLLAHDQPNSRVGAISFARRISRDLRKYVSSYRAALRRHLTHAELREFGLG